MSALNHGLGGGHLGLTHRRRGLHVDNNRVLHIDQIIGAIGIHRRPAPGSGPARRRIGWRDELWHDRRGAAKSRIVESSEVLRDRAVGLGIELIGRFDAALAMRVRDDNAGVDGKALAADQALGHAASNHRLEQLSQQVSIAEPAVPVL